MRINGLNNIARHRNGLLSAALVILLVVAQSLIAAHASGHPFHSSDGSCIVLSLAEKHSPLEAHGEACHADNRWLQVPGTTQDVLLVGIQPSPYQTRAPPLTRHN
jgi:hypothetical protein